MHIQIIWPTVIKLMATWIICKSQVFRCLLYAYISISITYTMHHVMFLLHFIQKEHYFSQDTTTRWCSIFILHDISHWLRSYASIYSHYELMSCYVSVGVISDELYQAWFHIKTLMWVMSGSLFQLSCKI